MKKIAVLITLLLVLSVSVQGQVTLNVSSFRADANGVEFPFQGAIDTVGGTYDSLASGLFDIRDYDGCDSLDWSCLVVSDTGNVKFTLRLLGSDYSTSIASAVVLKTILSASTTETEQGGSFSLSGIRKKYMWLDIEQTTGTGKNDDATFKVKLKLPKRDF